MLADETDTFGKRRSFKEAVKWYSKGVEMNHPGSQFNLALMLYDGLGADKDEDRAITLLRKAAKGPDASVSRDAHKILKRLGRE